MRYHKLILALFAILLTSLFTAAQIFAAGVPQMIPYSGTIASGGTPFNGSGKFKFAITNGHADCQTSPIGAGCVTLWSNDGTSTAASEPTNAVTIAVNNGLFAVKLGDTSLTNMLVIPGSVFGNDTTYLRIWFDDGVSGSQLLSPDRQLVSVPYAYRADVVTGTGVIGTAQIADGAVTANQIAPGAISSAQIASGAVGATQIASGSIGSAQIASGAIGSAQIAPGAIGAAQIADGSITDADIAPTANISDSKLHTITTAGKIASSALPADGYNGKFFRTGETITIVQESGPITVNSFGTLMVPCPSGYVAIGGGVDPENVYTMSITASGPTVLSGSPPVSTRPLLLPIGTNVSPNGWWGAVRNDSFSLGSYKFRVAVICSR